MKRSEAGVAKDDTLIALQRMARKMFPVSVAIGVTDPRRPGIGLLPAEAAATRGMVRRRREEFTAGRLAARQAMAALACVPSAVPMGTDRAPIWPEGLRGSLTHCATACLAVLTLDNLLLGADLEPDAPLPDDMTALVCNSAEQNWLARQPLQLRGQRARLIFSAKEAAYKAQYPVTRQLFGFQTLQILPDIVAGKFSVTFAEPVGRFSRDSSLAGSFDIAAGLILTGIVAHQAET